jgi:hypothetical protein
MKNLLPQQYKRLVWYDELGEEFLLLNYAEVFKYSDEVYNGKFIKELEGKLAHKILPKSPKKED